MKKILSLPLALLLVVVALTTVQAGGWAVVTVDDLPERFVAGEAVALRFSVRQHGMRLLEGLAPTVSATRGSKHVAAAAKPADPAGYYTASIALPETGDWTIRIVSGFGANALTLNPVKVAAAGTPAAPSPMASRGGDLFVAKGCATCHGHAKVHASPTVPIGADLSAKRYPADFLAKLLKDPSMLPPANGIWRMPNLNLQEQEVAALVAFINQPGSTTSAMR